MARNQGRAPGFGMAFAGRQPRQSRPALSQQAVVTAAIKILDAEGPAALTFRRLAADLGVGVASLYWHVASKEVLLDLALDAVAGEVYDALPAAARTTRSARSWRADLRDIAVRLYDELGRRGWAAEQQLVSRDRGPNQLRIWDYLGRIFFRAGFDEKSAFYGMSAVLSYVLGYVVQEVAAARSDVGRDEHLAQMGEFFASLDPAQFPAVRRIADVFATHDQREQFESGLDVLLDGLESQLRARPAKSGQRR
jgi:AcrR family transcriptional regulator